MFPLLSVALYGNCIVILQRTASNKTSINDIGFRFKHVFILTRFTLKFLDSYCTCGYCYVIVFTWYTFSNHIKISDYLDIYRCFYCSVWSLPFCYYGNLSSMLWIRFSTFFIDANENNLVSKNVYQMLLLTRSKIKICLVSACKRICLSPIFHILLTYEWRCLCRV